MTTDKTIALTRWTYFMVMIFTLSEAQLPGLQKGLIKTLPPIGH